MECPCNGDADASVHIANVRTRYDRDYWQCLQVESTRDRLNSSMQCHRAANIANRRPSSKIQHRRRSLHIQMGKLEISDQKLKLIKTHQYSSKFAKLILASLRYFQAKYRKMWSIRQIHPCQTHHNSSQIHLLILGDFENM